MKQEETLKNEEQIEFPNKRNSKPQIIREFAEGEQYLRQPAVLELTGFKMSSLWKFIRERNFPRSHPITPQLTVWRKSEILTWMEKAIADFQEQGLTTHSHKIRRVKGETYATDIKK